MKLPVPAIVVAIISVLVGGGVGFTLANSQAQEQIKQLQQELIRLQTINREREEMIRSLQRRISELEAEIETIKRQRGVLERFLRWLMGEHPDVIRRYQDIDRMHEEIVIMEDEVRRNEEVLINIYHALWRQYPEEMEELERRLQAE